MADTQPIPAVRDEPDPVDTAAVMLADATRELRAAAAWCGGARHGDAQSRADVMELVADRLACALEGLAWCAVRLESARAWRALRSPVPGGRHAARRRHLRLLPPP